MGQPKMSKKLLKFEERPRLANRRKTKVWAVISVGGNSFLGSVKWWPAWRRYVYEPASHIVMDAACLMEVTEFLTHETNEQKKTWKRPPK